MNSLPSSRVTTAQRSLRGERRPLSSAVGVMRGSLALRPRVEESPPPGERIGLHLDELALPLVVSCMARGLMLDFFFTGGSMLQSHLGRRARHETEPLLRSGTCDPSLGDGGGGLTSETVRSLSRSKRRGTTPVVLRRPRPAHKRLTPTFAQRRRLRSSARAVAKSSRRPRVCSRFEGAGEARRKVRTPR